MTSHNVPPTAETLEKTAAQESAGLGRAFLNESKAALKGAQAGSHEMVSWGQKAFQANLTAWQALMTCRSPTQAVAIQGRLIQDHLELLSKNGRRFSMASWKAAIAENDTHV